MTDHTPDSADPGHGSRSPVDGRATSLTALANALFAGLASTYTATRSVAITFLAGGLVAFAAVSIMVRWWRGGRG